MPGLLVVTPAGPDCDALCSHLRERGYVVHNADSGAVAVDVALRRLPDVILMDPALSAMDRWHAVKRLNTEIATSTIPVLTLASDAASPAGLQRVVSKVEQTVGRRGRTVSTSAPPVRTEPPAPRVDDRADALADALVDVSAEAPPVRTPVPARVTVRPEPGRASDEEPAPRRRPSLGRLLVVDDNALNRDMLSRRLTRRGYEVHVAEDGQKALDAIASQRFDLVLLDWMMPGLSGIDVLKKVREESSPIELPVIMATARTEADDVVVALKHEANDYVTKPLNFDVVNARIETQLGLARAHRQLAASERRYRALLENTGDMIVQYRPDGKITYVSPASLTLLGHEPEELRAQSWFAWLHPLDRRALEAQREAALPPAFTYICRMARRDQAWIWVEVSCRLVRDGDESVILAACRDVTEHMERLSGDEPPLPLGGDIMAHPGWRGGARDEQPTSPPSNPAKVVLLTVLDDIEAQIVDPGSSEALSREVARRLAQVLGGSHV